MIAQVVNCLAEPIYIQFSTKWMHKMTINWEAWKFLLGEWVGGNESDPGQGFGSFSFSFELDNNILVRKSQTVFPATKDREGYTHADLLIIYEEFTGLKRAIYFDNEQHVIHYEVNLSDDLKTITLESDPIPSAPQFRFTYIKGGENTIDARFEVAPPGAPGEYSLYLQGTAWRKGR
jgi:hypothetical protein